MVQPPQIFLDQTCQRETTAPMSAPSRIFSSDTLAAGVEQIQQQQVKQESPDEKAAMEQELKDLVAKDRCDLILKIF